jgi:hypothetical protein
MSEKNQKFILLAVGVLVTSLLAGYLIFAWTEPSQNPPQGNVPAPINVGSQEQIKSGTIGAYYFKVLGWDAVYGSFDTGGGVNRPFHLIGSYHGWDPYGVYIAGYNYYNNSSVSQAKKVYVGGGGTERLTIDLSTGNVGIGTTAPSFPLTIFKNGTSYYGKYPQLMVNGNNQTGGGIAISDDGGFFDWNDGWVTYESLCCGGLKVNSTLAVTGNVGIGTTAPGYKLEVVGSVGADAYYYRSDIKLKENVSEIKDALEKILKLQGINFTWKGSGEKSIGLIAQDVEKIFPELVKTDNSGMKSIDYGRLTAILIEGIKEQQKEINLLKQEIENLKIQIKGR